MNNRRKFLVAIGAGALAAPLGSFAQQGKIWLVGFLVPRSRPALDSDYVFAFPRAMRDLGYVEGKNLVIEWRFADGNTERLPALAAELVRQKVDIIVATGALPPARHRNQPPRFRSSLRPRPQVPEDAGCCRPTCDALSGTLHLRRLILDASSTCSHQAHSDGFHHLDPFRDVCLDQRGKLLRSVRDHF